LLDFFPENVGSASCRGFHSLVYILAFSSTILTLFFCPAFSQPCEVVDGLFPRLRSIPDQADRPCLLFFLFKLFKFQELEADILFERPAGPLDEQSSASHPFFMAPENTMTAIFHLINALLCNPTLYQA